MRFLLQFFARVATFKSFFFFFYVACQKKLDTFFCTFCYGENCSISHAVSFNFVKLFQSVFSVQEVVKKNVPHLTGSLLLVYV